MSDCCTVPATFDLSVTGDYQFAFFTECQMQRDGERLQISFTEKTGLLRTSTVVSFHRNGVFFERKLDNPFPFWDEFEDSVNESPLVSAFLSATDKNFNSVELHAGDIVKFVLTTKDLTIDFLPDGVSGHTTAFAVKNDRRTPDFTLNFRVKTR